jgi:hypothetical protein
MKKMLWMLAAAASLAACHNRGEDDMGAAPERGDTTAVTNDTTTGNFDTTTTAQPADHPDRHHGRSVSDHADRYHQRGAGADHPGHLEHGAGLRDER